MASMLNLGDIFELVIDGLDNEALAQQEFVLKNNQLVFHIGPQVGNQLDTLLEQGLEQGQRHIALVAKQFAKYGFSQTRDRFTVIDIARGQCEGQDVASVINDEV